MRYPTFKIVCVGHSLGGAIATITATELRKQFNNVVLVHSLRLLSVYLFLHFLQFTKYSYGAPRVGNGQFSIFVTDNGTNYRFTHLSKHSPRPDPLNDDVTIGLTTRIKMIPYHKYPGSAGATNTSHRSISYPAAITILNPKMSRFCTAV